MARQNRWLLLPLCLVLLFLSGCFFSAGEELYSLPQPPADYLLLQDQIEAVLDSGAEYAAPLAGNSTQPVQMFDLDGDGAEEALAFFRTTSGGESALQLYVFRQTETGYETKAVITGNASSFRSLACADLTGDGTSELVVGYQMSPNVYLLSVYDLTGEEPAELLSTSYARYTLYDMDSDGISELVVFYTEPGDQPTSARLYRRTDSGGLALHSAALLSAGAGDISSISTGLLDEGRPALYATSSFGDNGQITDVLALRRNVLTNITLDEELAVSSETLRYHSATVTDIDADGRPEIPQPVVMPDYYDGADTETYWLINWRRCRLDGSFVPVTTTFHNYQDGWYLIVPSSWVNRVSVTRSDTISGETAYIFGVRGGADEALTDFLFLYRLTGANRVDRSQLEGRFVLSSQPEVIYAAYLPETSLPASYQLTPELVSESFRRIITDWSHTDS
ncbi:MAG: VCBS repeat-containing protein [Oscillospiraceae bacterium]|nr:VCBS repeat-containing protein [Oscillospiraceae bacterium]